MSSHNHASHDRSQSGAGSARARGLWVFWAFLIIAGGYLIAEHRAHVAGVLPFLIILACPLLHMFMHGGHGGHGDHGRKEEGAAADTDRRKEI